MPMHMQTKKLNHYIYAQQLEIGKEKITVWNIKYGIP